MIWETNFPAPPVGALVDANDGWHRAGGHYNTQRDSLHQPRLMEQRKRLRSPTVVRHQHAPRSSAQPVVTENRRAMRDLPVQYHA